MTHDGPEQVQHAGITLERAKVIKRYHPPATPYERAPAHPKLPKAINRRLSDRRRPSIHAVAIGARSLSGRCVATAGSESAVCARLHQVDSLWRYAIGVAIEHAFDAAWFLKIEYQYHDFENRYLDGAHVSWSGALPLTARGAAAPTCKRSRGRRKGVAWHSRPRSSGSSLSRSSAASRPPRGRRA